MLFSSSSARKKDFNSVAKSVGKAGHRTKNLNFYRHSRKRETSKMIAKQILGRSFKAATGVRSLSTARKPLKSSFTGKVLLSTTAVLVTGSIAYIGFDYYLSKHQQITTKWPFKAKFYTNLGIFMDEVLHDPEGAVLSFNKSLKFVGEHHGHAVDKSKDNEKHGKFKLIPPEEVATKDKEWKNSYVDVVMRLALAKYEAGDIDNANILAHYSLRIPIDIGSVDLRSETLRLVSKIYAEKYHDLRVSENYLIDALKYNEYRKDLIFEAHGSYLLSRDSNLDDEVTDTLVDYGLISAKAGRYTAALDILKNVLDVLGTPKNYDPIYTPAKQALVKDRIGEVLIQKGEYDQSIIWFNESVREKTISDGLKKEILDHLLEAYEKTGDEPRVSEIKAILGSLDLTQSRESKYHLLKSLFLTDIDD